MDKVFRIIGRINSALFLLLLLGISGFIGFEVISESRHHRAPDSGDVTAVEMSEGKSREVKLYFGSPESVVQSEEVMLPLLASSGSEDMIGSKSNNGEMRNVLFIKSDGDAAWLFPGNANRLFDVDQVAEGASLTPNNGYDYDDDKRESGATRLLMISFALGEEVGASWDDTPMRVALAKPDGSGVTEVLMGVNSILARRLSASGVLTVIYQSGTGVHRAEYAVDGFRELSNRALAEIPKTL